ncbi:response regulator transcription factor [Paenibacillus turpanensis]|uniref:response regulator transcription factor n=1 Tax=Paenibacillus turpanensis TaxID=2689078 RepID=UPI00140A11E2|nr:response regulator [Paenibacillus turpanensis]
MFKVMLVDDERIILAGISAVVPWDEADTTLVGTARNGLEAYDMIVQDPPDIVISDIKMPGMDGIELVQKTYETHPEIRFILLSGFSEFDYARKAMHYGVKHYLLKPCNENNIVEALQEITAELKEKEGKEQFVEQMKYGLEKVLPHVKEQFLIQFVTNKTYGSRDWEYYRSLLGLDLESRKVRLLLFQMEGRFEFEHLFAMKNIAEELLEHPVLSATVGGHVLILVEDAGCGTELHDRIQEIKTTFIKYYKLDATIAVSDADEILRARKLYQQTLECLNHRFYLGEGSIITPEDIPGMVSPSSSLQCEQEREWSLDEDRIVMLVKAGAWEETADWIESFFASLSGVREGIGAAKSYVIQLYVSIVRLAEQDNMNRYMEQLASLVQMETLVSIRQFFEAVVKEITMGYFEQNRSKHSAIVQRVLEVIEECIASPELSLNWVAKQMLYMNADYLGKLFKKETGEKFSNYVMKLRIEKAIQSIEKQPDVKIFELAEQLGFGDNPQYFSQVFKKYTGQTPTEYMKMP